MNRSVVVLACAGSALCIAASADAALVDLTPGVGAAVNGTDVATDPEMGGMIPSGGDVLTPFQIFADPPRGGERGVLLFEGTLQSRVFISDVTNNAVFSHRIRDVNGGLNGEIFSVEVDDYSGMQTLVEWKSDGLGDTAPTRAQRSADGSDIEWLFGDTFPAGDESFFLQVLTDQPHYHFGGTATISLTTGESVTLKTWIPAPATLALVPMLGMAAARRRR